jgi:tRNA pseudouridine55 synthase
MTTATPATKKMADGAAQPPITGGILLLDKPVGVSSFQALRPLKRLFPKTKIGHAGTLDPAASGLLLIGIGSGTRLLEYLEGMPKAYAFTARFGLVSDSYDLEGAVEPHPGAASASGLDAAKVTAALPPFRGPIRQTPPAYSAIKVGGERAYDLARAGETVVLEPRDVTVHSLELKAFHPANGSAGPSADLVLHCSKGTYVRSLVNDLGAALGCGAVTDKIRRLAIGPFRVEDALAPEALVPGMALRPMDEAVSHLPAAVVPDTHVARFLNGQAVVPVSVPAPPAEAAGAPAEAADSEYRALDESGRLLAIAALSAEGRLCPRKVLAKA